MSAPVRASVRTSRRRACPWLHAWRAVALAAATCLAVPADAAIIEDVRWVTVADATVARLVLSSPVRVVGPPSRGAQQVHRIRLELAAVADAGPAAAPEVRQVQGGASLPEFTIAVSPVSNGRALEVTVQLREARSLQARLGSNARELDIVFPGLVAEAAIAPAAAAASAPQAGGAAPATVVEPAQAAGAPERPDDAALQAMEARAADLMEQARQALAAGRYEDAVNRLNQVLLLPPNRQSASAQALIGDAWAGAGDPRRARVEYALYLKLFPQGAEAPDVARKLAALGGSVPRPIDGAGRAETAGAPPPTPPAVRHYSGSIAQYYSGGKARSKTLVTQISGIDEETLTTTTESAIVTSVDLGARFDTDEAEWRAAVRGSGATNLSSTSHSSSLLSAAYIDYRDRRSALAVRVGRQSAISGGLLGLFDGVSLAYPVRPGVKLDLMGGVPANTLVSSPSQRLLAAMVELDGLVDRWGGNVYLVDQTSEGYTNRRGLGAELRYSAESWSSYAFVDYDTEFRAVNAASLQGSWQLPGQTTLTVLLDDRKAPALALNNVLISTLQPSLKDLFAANPSLTLTQALAEAKKTSASARQASLSLARPISEHWQVSGDLRYSEIGALPKVGEFEATPATGAQYTGTVQFTGTNLYSSRDINNFGMAVLTTPTFKGAQVSVSHLSGLRNNDLTLEPSLRYYRQAGPDGLKVQRVTPGLRLTYRASRRVSVLGEVLAERSTTESATSRGSTNAASFYMGYRYELF